MTGHSYKSSHSLVSAEEDLVIGCHFESRQFRGTVEQLFMVWRIKSSGLAILIDELIFLIYRKPHFPKHPAYCMLPSQLRSISTSYIPFQTFFPRSPKPGYPSKVQATCLLSRHGVFPQVHFFVIIVFSLTLGQGSASTCWCV